MFSISGPSECVRRACHLRDTSWLKTNNYRLVLKAPAPDLGQVSFSSREDKLRWTWRSNATFSPSGPSGRLESGWRQINIFSYKCSQHSLWNISSPWLDQDLRSFLSLPIHQLWLGTWPAKSFCCPVGSGSSYLQRLKGFLNAALELQPLLHFLNLRLQSS